MIPASLVCRRGNRAEDRHNLRQAIHKLPWIAGRERAFVLVGAPVESDDVAGGVQDLATIVGSVMLTSVPRVRVTESYGPTIPPRATWASGKLSDRKIVSPPRVELLTVTATELGSSSCLATSSLAADGMANAPVATRAAKKTEVYMFVLVAVVGDGGELVVELRLCCWLLSVSMVLLACECDVAVRTTFRGTHSTTYTCVT